MKYEEVALEVEKICLSVLGGFHSSNGDGASKEFQTLFLLEPYGPEFWLVFRKIEEFLGRAREPLDLWSMRIFNTLAQSIDAKAVFPLDGPPYAPFYSYGPRKNKTHESSNKLIVHDQSGLFVSFRGALEFREYIRLHNSPPNPRAICVTPCFTAFPVDAFASGVYNVAVCKSHSTSTESKKCLSNGCATQHSCPVSQSFGHLTEESAFHMSAFFK